MRRILRAIAADSRRCRADPAPARSNSGRGAAASRRCRGRHNGRSATTAGPLLARQRYRRMDALVAPLLGAPAKQRRMRRSAEGRAPTPAHQPIADVIVDRDQMPRGRRGGDDAADFGGEFRRHPLVGIDFEDPVAAAGVDPGMAARPLALPGALDQTLGKRRAISRERSPQRSSTTTISSAKSRLARQSAS